ncbi:F-box/kelch-repeat protein At3g06240-like [Apium graveolens]|uniref:F-box/kelch-repeat protein At3g06240-like n=1 Tax=Apium graveolens TaxID=4045 RepID=UPI003D7ACDB4
MVLKIWNPAIKQCLEIERHSTGSDLESSDCYKFGFGFDSVGSDYKVMCVKLEQQQPLTGYIYSCNGGCWSKITPSDFLCNCNLISAPFIYNGSPFWLMIPSHYKEEHPAVISCDVRGEIFRLLPDIGPIEKNHDKIYELVNFRDSLAVMSCGVKSLFWEETIDLYTFDKRCENWSKTSIGPFKFRVMEPIVFLKSEFLGYSNTGDILFFCPDMNKVYCANLQNYTIKSLEKEGDLIQCFMNGLVNYSESLVFIDGMKPLSETEDEIRYCYLRKE